eukprot:CAMPEP_0185783968 /NCGR_PEP_ID=MMETSP1174-20130828/120135_1 /TAXON_ID=35687 /ORGANISM="Dictyocha speculum, Strain CCMP1381" /LENGTH=77 /DNA_ID=CAMNT_0028475311 /DNA_START=221 /DNA_END=450 /DNA_ORIENTATION=+
MVDLFVTVVTWCRREAGYSEAPFIVILNRTPDAVRFYLGPSVVYGSVEARHRRPGEPVGMIHCMRGDEDSPCVVVSS